MGRRVLGRFSVSQSAAGEAEPVQPEKRKCARVAVGLPIACLSINAKGEPCGQVKGIVRNVSQRGLKLEAENDVRSNRLKLALRTVDKTIAEITGQVAFSRKTPSGTFMIGVQLEGDQGDVTRFVARLVRSHHYTKNKRRIG